MLTSTTTHLGEGSCASPSTGGLGTLDCGRGVIVGGWEGVVRVRVCVASSGGGSMMGSPLVSGGGGTVGKVLPGIVVGGWLEKVSLNTSAMTPT